VRHDCNLAAFRSGQFKFRALGRRPRIAHADNVGTTPDDFQLGYSGFKSAAHFGAVLSNCSMRFVKSLVSTVRM
jgi:hypothetical protein